MVLPLRAIQCIGDSAQQNTVFTWLASRYSLRFNIGKGCNVKFRDIREGKRTAAESRTALQSIKLLNGLFQWNLKFSLPSIQRCSSSYLLWRTETNSSKRSLSTSAAWHKDLLSWTWLRNSCISSLKQSMTTTKEVRQGSFRSQTRGWQKLLTKVKDMRGCQFSKWKQWQRADFKWLS